MSTYLQGDHFCYFGDGNACMILDFKEYIKKSTGIRYVKFIVIPSQLIEQQYNIIDRQDPSTRAMVVEYPSTDVIFLQRGTGRTRCWVLTDFLGGPTPASRRNQELAETLRDTERLLRSAEAAKNRAYQELEKERQQQMQAITTKIDMVRAVAKARGKLEGDGMGMEVDMGPQEG
jgi:hypothetical protein